MTVGYSRFKTRISVVSTLPPLNKAQIGELFYLTGDSKIYIRLASGWKATGALS